MSTPTSVLTQERLQVYSTAADKALAQVNLLIQAKHKELEEYNNLIHQLEELPKKRSAAVMCPVGTVGFLPATVVHTNEILVGLGDGYFVDTSAYHATEILKRRKSVIEKNIVDLHEHKNTIVKQISFAKEIFDHTKNSDEIEIREEYDEEKEAELRRKRKSRTPVKRPVTKTLSDIKAEAEMMKRLEELEQQELRNGELERDDDDNKPTTSHSLKTISEEVDEEETKQLVSALITNQPEKTCGRVVERSTEFLAQPSSAVPVSYDLNKTAPSSDSPPNQSDVTEVEAAGATSVGIFKGEDLVRMLTEQDEEYEEIPPSYQPPRGVSVEEYQKVLSLVDNTSSDESCSDKISEEEGEGDAEEDEYVGGDVEKGSELDSDDLSEPETVDTQRTLHSPSDAIAFEKLVAQNLGPNVDVIVPVPAGAVNASEVAESGAPSKCSTSDEADMDKDVNENRAKIDENDEKKKRKRKKKPKKKKSVMFAEKLEDATLIDSQAPPCETRNTALPGTSQSTKASILVNADERSPLNVQEVCKPEEPKRVVLPGSKEAFSGVIKERNIQVLATGDVPAASPPPSKPQSLFKMKRQQKFV